MEAPRILSTIDLIILGYSSNPDPIDIYWYRQFFRSLQTILEKYSIDNSQLLTAVPLADQQLENRVAFWNAMGKIRAHFHLHRPVMSLEQFHKPPTPTEFGPFIWALMHYVTFLFPNVPTPLDQNTFQTFFRSIQHVLPCPTCRKHLTEWYEKFPIRLDNKTILVEWLIHIHNQVNSSLSKRANWTLREVLLSRGKLLSRAMPPQQPTTSRAPTRAAQQGQAAQQKPIQKAKIRSTAVSMVPNFQFKKSTSFLQTIQGSKSAVQLKSKSTRHKLSCNCGRPR
jgi:hypothetical protein